MWSGLRGRRTATQHSLHLSDVKLREEMLGSAALMRGEERRGDVRHFCLYSGCLCSHLIVCTVWTEDSPAQPPCRSSLSSVDWRLWLGELLVSAPPGNTNNGHLSGREKGKDGNRVLLSVVYSHRSRCIAVIASF